MHDTHADPHIVTLEPSTVAVLREIVPMAALTPFFDRAFHAVPAVVGQQRITITGPPLAIYFGAPDHSVDVAAGFPTDAPVSPASSVTPYTLPGGRAARMQHHGPYVTLGESYGALTQWMAEQGLPPATVMWETYLTEPTADPSASVTEITWPVAEHAEHGSTD